MKTAIEEKVNQWHEKKAYTESEMSKAGVTSEMLFEWRVEVMVDFSRLRMETKEFRQSILGEKSYTDILLVNIVVAEHQLLMNVSVEEIDFKTYKTYILTILGKAHTSYSINKVVCEIIDNRKLKQRCKTRK